MKISIKNFLQNQDYKMEIDGEILENNTEYDTSELGLEYPIKYNGIIFNLGNEILLDLFVNYKYNTLCDRCLKAMKAEEKSHLEAYFTIDSSVEATNEDAEYFELSDGEILIDDIVISQVITSMPIKNLCDEDCKGLCPTCGKDLNEGSCSCNSASNVDIRFEKLLNLFNDEEV